MTAQIIKIPRKEEAPDPHKTFFENLAERTDQLIYMSKDKDGMYGMGHTPMDVKDLIFMCYHLQKLIEHTIIEGEVEDEE